MSQEGLMHKESSIGNQDSASIYIGKRLLVGTIADGCTSGTNLNGHSFNQVGAYFLSFLGVRIARRIVLKNKVSLAGFPLEFERLINYRLARTINAVHPWKFERKQFLNNLMSSTLTVFVITEKYYVILNCGDGDVFINGNRMTVTSSSGKYLSNNFVEFNSGDEEALVSMKIVGSGNTKNLDSLLIATDGLLDTDVLETPEFGSFFFDSKIVGLKNGFQDRRREFQKRVVKEVLKKKEGRDWPTDDATFISVIRTNTDKKT
ncbi:MAG: protein phosphatase 2C domain-containing protein [Flavobacteriales bacterium]|nr:protein phosphatase 2C domain-containing protein [Flavobacteriales bacterium]